MLSGIFKYQYAAKVYTQTKKHLSELEMAV